MTEAGRNLSTTIAPPVLRGAIPFVGMLPALSRDPLSVFMQARTLGDVVRLVVPGRHPIIVLAHPAQIRHVLQEKHGNYRLALITLGPRVCGLVAGGGSHERTRLCSQIPC